VTIQEAGGIRAAVEAAKAHVEAMLPLAEAARREPALASRLVIGLQTGAADGFCGLSANPALGAAVDLLVAQGGTAILSETPDLLLCGGAFGKRAADAVVAEALRARLDWWQDYGRGRDVQVNGRLDRADEDGGLVSALEKAMDGLGKAGRHSSGRGASLRGAGDRSRPRLHGQPGLRSCLRHRADGRQARR
jgi:altronate hydrolase